MMTLEDKVRRTLGRHAMLAPGDAVIAAVSGGADSIALFHLLLSLREELDIRLSAAHFEHGLRGEESLRDAEFVQALCKKEGVRLFLRYGKMSDEPKPAGESVESWARRLRYEFFERIAEENGAKVATAHTLSDNAETVLFHAVRGAGPRGLSGIPPVRGSFIRPMLDVSRAEVEAYCLLCGISYRTDATNADTGFTRNRLRLEVMPRLEQVHSGAAYSLARLADDMRELDGWLARMAAGVLDAAGEDSPAEDGVCLNAELLGTAPGPVLRKALAMLVGKSADRAALDRAEAVLRGKVRAAQMPGGVTVHREGGRFCLAYAAGPGVPEGLDYEIPALPGAYELPGGYRLRVHVRQAEGKEAARFLLQNGGLPRGEEKKPVKGLTFCADYDKIYHCGILRTRRPGDMFSFPARGVSKSLKKWMNEQKLDASLRASLPVMALPDSGDLYWIWGEGFSAHVQPDQETRRFLVIRQEDES